MTTYCTPTVADAWAEGLVPGFGSPTTVSQQLAVKRFGTPTVADASFSQGKVRNGKSQEHLESQVLRHEPPERFPTPCRMGGTDVLLRQTPERWDERAAAWAKKGVDLQRQLATEVVRKERTRTFPTVRATTVEETLEHLAERRRRYKAGERAYNPGMTLEIAVTDPDRCAHPGGGLTRPTCPAKGFGLTARMGVERGVDWAAPVKKLPTPVKADGAMGTQWKTKAARDAAGYRSMLSTEVVLEEREPSTRIFPMPSPAQVTERLPTPRKEDANHPNGNLRRTGTAAGTTSELVSAAVTSPGNGLLNPGWVEWLMGWPIGWTALPPLATDRFRRWSRLHGRSCPVRPTCNGARSRIMRAVRRERTGPEEALAAALAAAGVQGAARNDVSLPGSPDFAFHGRRVAVFVDGCFWHACPEHYVPPVANAEWWAKKATRNARRDAKDGKKLEAAGWTVVRLWEHCVRDVPGACVDVVVGALRKGSRKAGAR